jgi:hypothetical protein
MIADHPAALETMASLTRIIDVMTWVVLTDLQAGGPPVRFHPRVARAANTEKKKDT